MTIEPRTSGKLPDPSAHRELGAAAVNSTSPLRWLFVLAPILVIVVTAGNLLGRWSTPSQQALPGARDQQRQAADPKQAQTEHYAEPDAPGPDRRESTIAKPVDKPPANAEDALQDIKKQLKHLFPQRDPANSGSPPSDPPDDGTPAPAEIVPEAEPEPAFDVYDVVALLPKADPLAGASVFRRCGVCHTDQKGELNKIGPNLWGIIGRKKGAHPGFRYSAAMKAEGGTWSAISLAEYLHNPRRRLPGTTMAFGGLSRPDDIANIIGYLRTLSD